MISWCPIPLLVIIKETKQDAYLLYVESGGQYNNDIWTCILCEGGIVRHYQSSQVVVCKNSTFNIIKKENT